MNLEAKYFDETEVIEMWDFTRNKLGTIGYNAAYIAARELGMSVVDAKLFCTSKWVRHNQEYLEEIFAQGIITAFGTQEMFSSMMNYVVD